MTEVVITGVGSVGAHGVGAKDLAALLAGGVARTTRLPAEPRRGRPVARTACLVDPERLRALLPPRIARRMSPASRLAVAAAQGAVAHAGLDGDALRGADTAVALGTAFGTSEFTQGLLHQIRDTGPESASPFLFMETVASAHAGQVALALGAHGPNYTVSQREASGLLALCRGADLVRSGRARRVLAGNVDEVTPYQHAVLDAWRALARPGADGVERARVFDRRRDGFLCAAGATVLLLEDAASAEARGARVVARVRAAVRGFDATAPRTDWGEGAERLAEAARRGLARAGVESASIDRVASGASGARRGDRLEGATLRALFAGSELPPVLAPKAVTGEYGGGFLAAAAQATGPVHWPTEAWFDAADAEVGVRPHGAPLDGAARVLVSTLAAGGAAAWLVLDPV